MTGLLSTPTPARGRSSLRFLTEIDGSSARVTLRGQLDVDTVWSFGAELLALIRAGRRDLTVDLGELDVVSTICVGVVNRTVAELKAVDGSLILCGADDSLAARLRGAGLHTSVPTPRAYKPAVAEPRKRRRGLSDTA